MYFAKATKFRPAAASLPSAPRVICAAWRRPEGATMRILLVEDHPAMREMVADHLARRGFAVDADPAPI
jgi:hypothetical protein